LSHSQHKFKVDTNAQQLGLTGVAVLNPEFALVIVEGGARSIKSYKKLMLRRIQWSSEEDDEMSNPEEEKKENRCILVWQGETKQKSFRQFRFHLCPTEGLVKEKLSKSKAEHFWDLAKASDSEKLWLEQQRKLELDNNVIV
jgi:U4/U6 small nuclear ribonucleoprotein PRP3